jgi:tetratricopeptide (TPR) repeat protein
VEQVVIVPLSYSPRVTSAKKSTCSRSDVSFSNYSPAQKRFQNDHAVTQYYAQTGIRGHISSLGPPPVASFFSQNPPHEPALGVMGLALLSRLLHGDPAVRPSSEFLGLQFASNRWISFATYYYHEMRTQMAIEAYKMATNISAVDSTIWRAFGDAYFTAKAYPEALEAYDRARSAGYDNPIDEYDVAKAELNPIGAVNGPVAAAVPPIMVETQVDAVATTSHTASTPQRSRRRAMGLYVEDLEQADAPNNRSVNEVIRHGGSDDTEFEVVALPILGAGLTAWFGPHFPVADAILGT